MHITLISFGNKHSHDNIWAQFSSIKHPNIIMRMFVSFWITFSPLISFHHVSILSYLLSALLESCSMSRSWNCMSFELLLFGNFILAKQMKYFHFLLDPCQLYSLIMLMVLINRNSDYQNVVLIFNFKLSLYGPWDT